MRRLPMTRMVQCLSGLAVAVAFAVFSVPMRASAKDDFQIWDSLDVRKNLGPHWELFFAPQIRVRDDASDLFYHEYRQGIRWKSPHLQVGVNYLFVRNTSASISKVNEEHTGELDVTPKTTIQGVNLSLRGRLSMRTIQRSAGEQEWQIRLMPKIAYPLKLGTYTVTPYAADDLFYEYTRKAWNQNRVFLGVVLPLHTTKTTKLTLDCYYLLQSVLGSGHDWSSNHIFGTTIGLEF